MKKVFSKVLLLALFLIVFMVTNVYADAALPSDRIVRTPKEYNYAPIVVIITILVFVFFIVVSTHKNKKSEEGMNGTNEGEANEENKSEENNKE